MTRSKKSPAINTEELKLLEELRELIEAAAASGHGRTEEKGALEEYLRDSLGDYIDPETDCVGFAAPIGEGRYIKIQADDVHVESCTVPIRSLAGSLVQGCEVIGAEYIADLLSKWLRTQSVGFSVYVVFDDYLISAPLSPVDGVRLKPLGLSSDELDELPDRVLRRCQGQEWSLLNRTVASLDCVARPALFRPQDDHPVRGSWAGIDPETLCRALALECNNSVTVALRWHDFQEAEALCDHTTGSWVSGRAQFRHLPPSGYTWSSSAKGKTFTLPERVPTPAVSETRLSAYIASLSGAHKLRLATAWWMKAKDESRSLEDRLISLRIALESLYLQGLEDARPQEMRFRLSLHGAWHLGVGASGRADIRRKLRDCYDAASSVVHTGEVSSGTSQSYRKLLGLGQDLCHQGIVKSLEEGLPRWDLLILGSQYGEDEPPSSLSSS